MNSTSSISIKVDLPYEAEKQRTPSLLGGCLKQLSFLGGVSALRVLTTPLIVKVAEVSNICLGKILPSSLESHLYNLIGISVKCRDAFSNIVPNNPLLKNFLLPATFEELQFRGLIQGFLLKELPQRVIHQISPETAKWFDSIPAKVSRIALTALLFAIFHAEAHECVSHGGLHQLIGGLIYGAIAEFHESALLTSTTLHFVHNVLNEEYGEYFNSLFNQIIRQ